MSRDISTPVFNGRLGRPLSSAAAKRRLEKSAERMSHQWLVDVATSKPRTGAACEGLEGARLAVLRAAHGAERAQVRAGATGQACRRLQSPSRSGDERAATGLLSDCATPRADATSEAQTHLAQVQEAASEMTRRTVGLIAVAQARTAAAEVLIDEMERGLVDSVVAARLLTAAALPRCTCDVVDAMLEAALIEVAWEVIKTRARKAAEAAAAEEAARLDAAAKDKAITRLQARARVKLAQTAPSRIAALVKAGRTATELRAGHARAATLLAADVDAREMCAAGYGARELHVAGVDVYGLRSAGYSTFEAMEAVGAAELVKAGFSLNARELTELRKVHAHPSRSAPSLHCSRALFSL
jgi:hypothetical protein